MRTCTVMLLLSLLALSVGCSKKVYMHPGGGVTEVSGRGGRKIKHKGAAPDYPYNLDPGAPLPPIPAPSRMTEERTITEQTEFVR